MENIIDVFLLFDYGSSAGPTEEGRLGSTCRGPNDVVHHAVEHVAVGQVQQSEHRPPDIPER